MMCARWSKRSVPSFTETELYGCTGLSIIAPSPILTEEPFTTENAVRRRRLFFPKTTSQSSPIVMSELIVAPASTTSDELLPSTIMPRTSFASSLIDSFDDGWIDLFPPGLKVLKRRLAVSRPGIDVSLKGFTQRRKVHAKAQRFRAFSWRLCAFA